MVRITRKDVKTAEKYCKYCGKKLERRRFESGRLETYGVFVKRKYCDRECMRKGFLKPENEKQSYSNAHTTARLKNALIMKRTECEKCGKTGRLDVHHIDGDYTNNSIDNLLVVCRSCHLKIHRAKPKCKVDGCDKKVKGYGYCEKHYQRYKKNGDPLKTKFDLRKEVI